MAKSLGKRVITCMAAAGLLTILSLTRDTYVPSRKFVSEKSLQTTQQRRSSEKEEKIIEDFDLNYREVMWRRVIGKPFRKYVDEMLDEYPNLSPYMQEQVKGDVEGGLVFLKNLYKVKGTPEEFCPYHSEAIRLGLEAELEK